MFNGLEDRFLAKQKELYDHSARDESGQPFIETKPTDKRQSLRHVSRMNFGASVARDVSRLNKLLKTSEGRLWLLNQQNLQSGNTFTQTRLINPLFVLANTVPTIHLRRSLATPTASDPSGDTSVSATDVSMGVAGRLQKHTALTTTSLVTSGKGGALKHVLRLLPPSTVINTIAGVTQLLSNGSLGINQRPELDVNNNNKFDSYYSTLLWQGFSRQQSPVSKLERAAAQFRNGNFVSAARNVVNGGTDTLLSAVNIGKQLFGGKQNPIKLYGRYNNNAAARSEDSPEVNGLRYFIKNPTQADRYLANSVEFVGDKPYANMMYLQRRPYYSYEDKINTLKITNDTSGESFSTSLNRSRRKVDGILRDVNRAITRGAQFLSTGVTPSNILDVAYDQQLLSSIKNSATALDENPAEQNMTFQQLSMRARYETDGRIDDIRQQLAFDTQRWKGSLPTTTMGYVGPMKAGDELIPDPYAKNKFVTSGQYLSDPLNAIAFIDDPSPQLTQTSIDALRQQAPQLVDLFIFDFINRRAIPFRAYIRGLTENVSPEFDDSTRYIGRIEKNVTYSGVSRDCSFSIMIHAFNDSELNIIWQKINYLTGLCFPAQYSDGFMVPPLVMLTLGDVYNNQPGYISSLSMNVEDDVPWEVTPGLQAPHGVTINLSFRLLEKSQMQTNSTFYNFGLPRSTGMERRRNSFLSESELEQSNATATSAKITNQIYNTPSTPQILRGNNSFGGI